MPNLLTSALLICGTKFSYDNVEYKYIKGDEVSIGSTAMIVRIMPGNRTTHFCNVSKVADDGFHFFTYIFDKRVHGFVSFSDCYLDQ